MFFLMIVSLAGVTFALPVSRATAIGGHDPDGSRPMLNITARAGNDSNVTFNLFGSTYVPVLKGRLLLIWMRIENLQV